MKKMPRKLATPKKKIHATKLSNKSKNLLQGVVVDDIDIASTDEHRYPHQRDASGKMLVAWPAVAFAASTASAAAAAAAAVIGLSAMVAWIGEFAVVASVSVDEKCFVAVEFGFATAWSPVFAAVVATPAAAKYLPA
jgi:hypothetical protein